MSFGRTRASTCGRSSVEYAAEPSPGKCFTHAASPSPRANATAIVPLRNWREPSGPSAVSSTGPKARSTPAACSAVRVARTAALRHSDGQRSGRAEDLDAALGRQRVLETRRFHINPLVLALQELTEID